MFEKLKEKLFEKLFKEKAEEINKLKEELQEETNHYGQLDYDMDKLHSYLEEKQEEINEVDSLKERVKYLGVSNMELYNDLTSVQDDYYEVLDELDEYKKNEADYEKPSREVAILENGIYTRELIDQESLKDDSSKEEEPSFFIKENIKNSYVLNKDLSFEDGSFIKAGTEFMLEGEYDIENGKVYNVHFAEEGNIYNRENGTGEGYSFSEQELKSICKLDSSIDDINNNERRDILKTLTFDISPDEREFIVYNYKSYNEFIDKYIEDMDKYKEHELKENKQEGAKIGIQEYIEHEMKSDYEKSELEYDNWNENTYMERWEESILGKDKSALISNNIDISNPVKNKLSVFNNIQNDEYEM